MWGVGCLQSFCTCCVRSVAGKVRATYSERSVPDESAAGVLTFDPAKRWATFEEPVAKWEGGKPLPAEAVLLQHLSHLLKRDIVVIFVSDGKNGPDAQYETKAAHLVSARLTMMLCLYGLCSTPKLCLYCLCATAIYAPQVHGLASRWGAHKEGYFSASLSADAILQHLNENPNWRQHTCIITFNTDSSTYCARCRCHAGVTWQLGCSIPLSSRREVAIPCGTGCHLSRAVTRCSYKRTPCPMCFFLGVLGLSST